MLWNKLYWCMALFFLMVSFSLKLSTNKVKIFPCFNSQNSTAKLVVSTHACMWSYFQLVNILATPRTYILRSLWPNYQIPCYEIFIEDNSSELNLSLTSTSNNLLWPLLVCTSIEFVANLSNRISSRFFFEESSFNYTVTWTSNDLLFFEFLSTSYKIETS